jgi:predicted nucleic acid-binding protein
LERHIERFTVQYADQALCLWWAAVVDGASRKGYKIGTADAWNAATALMYGVAFVTHNPADYRGIAGLKIITEA